MPLIEKKRARMISHVGALLPALAYSDADVSGYLELHLDLTSEWCRLTLT
jgi:hypothetical protein